MKTITEGNVMLVQMFPYNGCLGFRHYYLKTFKVIVQLLTFAQIIIYVKIF
jgi:hypothetical protein